MEQLLIFTNASSIENKFRNFYNLYPAIKDISSKKIFALRNGKLEDCTYIINDDIYFIWDGYKSETDINNHFVGKKPQDNNKWYVVHHSHGIKIEEVKGKITTKPGIHDTTCPVYSRLFDILSDNSPDKLNRIIKTLFSPPLEAALEFLHGCLVEKPADYEKLKAEGIKTVSLPLLKDYNNESWLIDMRDKLLKEVLAE